MFSKQDPRPKYDPQVLKECYDRANRSIRVYDHFRPNLSVVPVTGKFYSKDQSVDVNSADPKWLDLVKTYKEKLPKQRYVQPQTSNQVYGWYSDPLVPMYKSDDRYWKPKKEVITKVRFPRKRGV